MNHMTSGAFAIPVRRRTALQQAVIDLNREFTPSQAEAVRDYVIAKIEEAVACTKTSTTPKTS